MNIIRNKYILLSFLAELFYYKDQDAIKNAIYSLIKNPTTHGISLDLIKNLMPLIIKFLNLMDTDIYLTYQSNYPEITILGENEQVTLENALCGMELSKSRNNKIFLLGVSCWYEDNALTSKHLELCHREGIAHGYHNEADDIVCVLLYSFFDKFGAGYRVPEYSIWSFDNYKWYTDSGNALRNYYLRTTIQYDLASFNTYRQSIVRGSIFPQNAITLVKNDASTGTSIEYSYANGNFVNGINDYIQYLDNNLQITVPADVIAILNS